MLSLWHNRHFWSCWVVILMRYMQLFHITHHRWNYNSLMPFATCFRALGKSAILLVTLYLNLHLVRLDLVIVWSIDAAAWSQICSLAELLSLLRELRVNFVAAHQSTR